MRALSLFTGYGGIDLALKDYITGVLSYVEIEEYAQRIIAERMADGSLPRATILADVKNVEGQLGICDIIYGGFPCQDISVAGLGKGLAGERSGLFYEIIRLTKEIRPTFVFLENVPAIRTRGLEQVIKAFTEIGYDCRWTCLSAASVGANHKRERWFLLAHANGDGYRGEVKRGVRVPQKVAGVERPQDCATGKLSRASGSKRDIPRIRYVVPDPCGERLERQRQKSCGAIEKLDYARDASWWETEPDVGRVVDGCAFRVDRIKALGNGVVPLQVKKAFELLLGVEVINE